MHINYGDSHGAAVVGSDGDLEDGIAQLIGHSPKMAKVLGNALITVAERGACMAQAIEDVKSFLEE